MAERSFLQARLMRLKKSNTSTAAYLTGKKKIEFNYEREQKKWLEISDVELNNIRSLSTKIPLSNFVCITGVSGSGKSTLILQALLPSALQALNRSSKAQKLEGVKIEGLGHLDKVIYLDQSPIGRTPRSNPVTYTGVMDEIRKLFIQTKESKLRGYKAGRFSFNVKGGTMRKVSR